MKWMCERWERRRGLWWVGRRGVWVISVAVMRRGGSGAGGPRERRGGLGGRARVSSERCRGLGVRASVSVCVGEDMADIVGKRVRIGTGEERDVEWKRTGFEGPAS